jgi:hypothetical protein
LDDATMGDRVALVFKTLEAGSSVEVENERPRFRPAVHMAADAEVALRTWL